MKKSKLFILSLFLSFGLIGCNLTTPNETQKDITNTQEVADKLVNNQPTPTDISYSLERYNLIRRAYWVNGEKEKARNVPRPSEVPLGYCVLFSDHGDIIAQFGVDGKISSLNSYLTPSMQQKTKYKDGSSAVIETELPDIDGSYGANDSNGVFFFTPSWQYIEWNGMYIYSDTPFAISSTILGVY